MTAQYIQVNRRRFAYMLGNTFLGVWELKPLDPALRVQRYQKLSFVFERPDTVERKWLRERIIQQIEKQTDR